MGHADADGTTADPNLLADRRTVTHSAGRMGNPGDGAACDPCSHTVTHWDTCRGAGESAGLVCGRYIHGRCADRSRPLSRKLRLP